MSLLDSVRRTMRLHEMVPPGGRVVVALSGGADSVALLHILRELDTSGELVVAGVAHFNHRLRGDASDEDERFCRGVAAAMGIPAVVGGADVRETARGQKRSIEDAARRLRYGFLREAAAHFRADGIAVGHSRDDQAETFLLRLLRGAGTRGLGSIRPRNGKVIRPLIDVARADLRRYVAERGLSFREDATNADVSVPRNRVRHELLPYLERAFSPNIVEVLAREAALAREDDERLQNEAIDLAASIVLTDTPSESSDRVIESPVDWSIGQSSLHVKGAVLVDADRLRSLHPAIGSRVARLALAHLARERFVGFAHVQAFLNFVRARVADSALSLPGQQARLGLVRGEGDDAHKAVVVLGPEPPRQASVKPKEARSAKAGSDSPELQRSDGGNSFRFSLSIPGEVVLAAQGWTVSADRVDGPADVPPRQGLAVLVQGLDGPLTVRSRCPGDRFQPPGLGGRTRKLQDYLVDRKVPRSARDLLPLVVDRDDRIVWIVGHAVAEGFRAAEPSPGVILLIARHLGGEV